MEMERQVIEIRLRAERRCGELLSEMEMNRGGGDQRSDHRSTEPRGDRQTLRDLGISYDQSSQWQKLVAVPADEFEADLADPAWRPSTTGIIDRRIEIPAQWMLEAPAVAAPAPFHGKQRAGATAA
jgi:hypothetical protein